MKHSSFFITTLSLCIFFCSPLYGKLPTPTIQNTIHSSNEHNDDNDKTRNRIHNMHRNHQTHHLDPQDPYFNKKQQEYYIKLQNYIKQCEQRFNSTRIQVIDTTLQTCEHAVTLTLAPLEEQFSYTAGDLYIDLKQTYYDHIHCNDHSLKDELAHALNKLGNKVIQTSLTSKRFLARIYRIDARGVTFEILKPGEGLPHIKLATFDIRNIPEQYYFQAHTPASVLIPLHEQPTNSNPHPDQPLTEQRVDALIETIENPGTVLTQKHTLSQRVCDLLKEHGFDPERFANSTGTPLEQQFYNEIQSIIDKAATISDNDLTELCKQYAHSACIVSDLAHQFNTQHDIEKTAVTLNLGHSIINAAESYTAACAHGIVDGVYNAGAHAYNMVRHPVQTAQSYIESCTHVAQALHDFTTRVLYHNPANPDSQNSFIGRLSHECSELYTFCSDCAATIAQLPPEEIIYHTTAFAVELLASHKIASLVKSTVSVGKAHILDKYKNNPPKKIKQSHKTKNIAKYKDPVKDLCIDATPQPKTGGKATIYDKPINFKKGNEIFDNLPLTDVKDYGNGIRKGTLPDGRTVVIRPKSSGKIDPKTKKRTGDGPATLEIQEIDPLTGNSTGYKTKFRLTKEE